MSNQVEEEVNLQDFTSWFEEKMFNALAYELSRINQAHLKLMDKVNALKKGCEDLK